MAHSLGLKILAEGVENEHHFEYLKKNNCDYMQGYLFSEPIPAESFKELLLKGEPKLSFAK